jgi:hypothetical protein
LDRNVPLRRNSFSEFLGFMTELLPVLPTELAVRQWPEETADANDSPAKRPGEES